MTYPPANPGYPAPLPGPPPGPYAAPMTRSGPSRVPAYLVAAVLGLGLLAYLASFAPQLSIKTDMGPFGGAQLTASGLSYWTIAALAAALLAGVSLLPKVASYAPVVAALSVLGALLVVAQVLNSPKQFSLGWGLWMGLMMTVLQAAAAVAALLLESGVIRTQAPRPGYGAYGPPPSYYPGAPGGQWSGPPAPYGGFPPGSGGLIEDSVNTPPTGFPSYQPSTDAETGPAAAAGSGSAPTTP